MYFRHWNKHISQSKYFVHKTCNNVLDADWHGQGSTQQWPMPRWRSYVFNDTDCNARQNVCTVNCSSFINQNFVDCTCSCVCFPLSIKTQRLSVTNSCHGISTQQEKTLSLQEMTETGSPNHSYNLLVPYKGITWFIFIVCSQLNWPICHLRKVRAHCRGIRMFPNIYWSGECKLNRLWCRLHKLPNRCKNMGINHTWRELFQYSFLGHLYVEPLQVT